MSLRWCLSLLRDSKEINKSTYFWSHEFIIGIWMIYLFIYYLLIFVLILKKIIDIEDKIIHKAKV